MRKIFFTAIVLAGLWYHFHGGATTGSHRILYYVDPMHPAYRSDKPGIAPDCGMQLQPVYADARPIADEKDAQHLTVLSGTVQVSPEKQRLLGVQVGSVEKTSETHMLRTLGRVALDETRVSPVSAAVDGWIRAVGPAVTGTVIHKDEVLAAFYNRDFLTAQQSYLYALNTMDSLRGGSAGEEQLKLSRTQVQAAEENLEYLGMSQTQLKEVARTRQIARNIELRSPTGGIVLARNVFAGLRFDKGRELFRIGQLNRVWIVADLYEQEGQHLLRGAVARVTVPRERRTFRAIVSYSLPQFDPDTRTLKVRLEVENPGYVLRPDMFVDVELPVQIPAGLTVPADAVLDSGLSKHVFVDRGNGVFEPREVETGWHSGDRVQVVKGLVEGEPVVVSGTFLVDSESRLKTVTATMQRSRKTSSQHALSEH